MQRGAVTIKVTREESPDICGFCNVGASRVTYTANLGVAQEMPIMINAELFKKSTGRNHRKKDRARARLARARRRKLLERLKHE